MSDKLARALAGVPAYQQPFMGPHNAPYKLPPFEQAGAFSNQVMPPLNPTPQMGMEGGMPPASMEMHGMQAPRPQAATMPPMQAPQPAQMPQQQSVMGMGFDPTPPLSMEMQGMKAPMPQGRNELERDYYNQLAQNPNGFGKPDWLARWLG
jgi:hypothetical protein